MARATFFAGVVTAALGDAVVCDRRWIEKAGRVRGRRRGGGSRADGALSCARWLTLTGDGRDGALPSSLDEEWEQGP